MYSTLGTTWTTAHRLAASYINRNTQHDRDHSNLANHKAPTTGPAPAIARQTQELKQTRKTDSPLTFFQKKSGENMDVHRYMLTEPSESVRTAKWNGDSVLSMRYALTAKRNSHVAFACMVEKLERTSERMRDLQSDIPNETVYHLQLSGVEPKPQ